MTTYIQIQLRESESTGWLGRPLYREIVYLLWHSGAPGITVFRGEEGLDEQGHIQNMHSEYLSDALPITLHLIVDGHDVMERLMQRIRTRLEGHDSVIFVTEAKNARLESIGTQGGERMKGSILKIYMKEEDRYNGVPLYHSLVRELRKRNILWVNVQRALEGFGADHVIRQNRIFEFANHSPVLVEVTCTDEQMHKLVNDLQPLLAAASGPSIVVPGQFMAGHDHNTLTL